MSYSVDYFENRKLYGQSVIITKSQEKNYGIINDFWKEFNGNIKKFNLSMGTGGNWEKYGVTYKTGDIYKYFCGIPLEYEYTNDVFTEFKLIGGNYAIFQHKGAMCNLKITLFNIYKKIIPENNLLLNQREYLHFELYNHKFKWNNKESIIGIYIPINIV